MPQGFSLIEVLITLFILSLGLLGIAGLELTALRNTQDIYLQSVASTQLTAMAERLRANQSHAAQVLECERWNIENQRLLPQAKGICVCQNATCTLTLNWHDFVPRTLTLQLML